MNCILQTVLSALSAAVNTDYESPEDVDHLCDKTTRHPGQ